MDHSEAEKHVYLTIRAYLLANGDRDNAVNRLVEDGLPRVAAGLRADLVPMAFGWGLLKKMGVKRFPSKFNLLDTGEQVKVSDSHVFTTALCFAYDVFENGYTETLSKRVVEMLVYQSAEVNAISDALNAEPKLELSEVSFSSSLFGYSAEDYTTYA